MIPSHLGIVSHQSGCDFDASEQVMKRHQWVISSRKTTPFGISPLAVISLRNWFLFYALGLAAVPSLELLEVRMLPFLRTYVMIPLVPPSPIEHFLNSSLFRANTRLRKAKFLMSA